jgi:putative N6-adenine-specific DNA methylase
MALLYTLLIGSRFANRVYLSVWNAPVHTFDDLYTLCSSINWKEYISGKERIIIESATKKSQLTSIPTIQSISQKAIFSTLLTPNNTNGTEVHILILLIDNVARILIDVTGDPLHKRWYRKESGEAPIKENLAAALVAFSYWKYTETLYDPFCGSGTIAIEAAMIARNIAPGMHRHFRIAELPCFSPELFESAKKRAQSSIYPSGKYHILARDIDPEMIEIAKRNALRAGVGDDIVFESGNFLDKQPIPLSESYTLLTNPPYGNRLTSPTLSEIYTQLIHDIEQHGWGCITSVDIGKHSLSNKKLLNWGEECRFWYKKHI